MISSSTRGAAAAMMDYVNGCHRLHLTLANGQTLPVDASISSMLANTGLLFVVDLGSIT